MFIARQAETLLNQLLQTQKIILILGARQVGKTTLVKHACERQGTTYLNLDLEVDRARLKAAAHLTPAQAMQSLRSPQILIIDEAQRLAETGRIIKGWYDAALPTQIILLGSSSLNLLDATAESLAGRNLKLELPPFTLKEILPLQDWYTPDLSSSFIAQHFSEQLTGLLTQQLAFGAYPESFLTADKEGYLLNLANDYALKDIFQSELIKSPQTVLKLLIWLAKSIGEDISTSDLATVLQISRITVDKYLDLLERCYLIFRLTPYSTNLKSEIVKSSKIYFWDTGIRNALLKDFSTSPYRTDLEALWKNWVVAEATKQNLLDGNRGSLHFWRTSDGSEVDLVIRHGDSLKAYNTAWQKQGEKETYNSNFTAKYKVTVELTSPENPLL